MTNIGILKITDAEESPRLGRRFICRSWFLRCFIFFGFQIPPIYTPLCNGLQVLPILSNPPIPSAPIGASLSKPIFIFSCHSCFLPPGASGRVLPQYCYSSFFL